MASKRRTELMHRKRETVKIDRKNGRKEKRIFLFFKLEKKKYREQERKRKIRHIRLNLFRSWSKVKDTVFRYNFESSCSFSCSCGLRIGSHVDAIAQNCVWSKACANSVLPSATAAATPVYLKTSEIN